MRTNIVHIGAGELTYEIRNIVNVGMQLERLGLKTNWENIGDPVAKGEVIPGWMKEIVAKAVMDDSTYGYCPTKGVLDTRRFLAEMTNSRGACRLTQRTFYFLTDLVMRYRKYLDFSSGPRG